MPQDSLTSSPSQQDLRAERAKRIAERIPAALAAPRPVSALTGKKMTVGGFVENTIRDAKEILTGLVDVLPAAARGAADVWSLKGDIPLLWKYPETTARSLGDTAARIKDAVVEPYQKYGVRILYEKPVTAASDALAAFDILGISVRAAGKVAGSARLVEYGTKIQRLPYLAASKLIQKGVKTGTGIDLEKRGAVLGLKARELAQVPIREKEIASDLYKDLKNLDEDQLDSLNTIFRTGDEGAITDPLVKSAYDKYAVIQGAREEELIRRGLLTREGMDNVRAKKSIVEFFEDVDFSAPREDLEELFFESFSIANLPVVKNILEEHKSGIFEKIREKAIEKETKILVGDYVRRELSAGSGKSISELEMAAFEDMSRVAGENVDARPISGKTEKRVTKIARARTIKSLKTLDETATEAAKRYILTLRTPPIYVPSIFDRKGFSGATINDLLKNPIEMLKKMAGETGKILAPEIRRGKVSFLEKYRGKYGSIRDPRVYLPKSIRGFLEMEANLRWIDNILQDPSLAISATGKGAVTELELETLGILKKYFHDPARAQAVFVRDVARRYGISESVKLLFEKESIAKLREISEVILDPTVKAILDAEFATIGGKFGRFIRIYDRITNLFRTSATILNPKWYTGNIVGDAILSIMAGVTLGDWRYGKKIMDAVPPERRFSGVAIEQTGAFMEGSKLRIPAEFVQQIDNAVGARILTADVAKRLKITGQEFFGMDGPFEDALKAFLSAPKMLGEANSKMQLLHENAARLITDKIGEVSTRELLIDAEKLFKKVPKNTAEKKAILLALEKIDGKLKKRKRWEHLVSDLRAEAVKAGRLEISIPGLREMSDFVRPSIERANAFLGNYLGLGPWERKIFRRIVPFYTWMKAMNLLAFRYPFLAPKSAFFWHRYSAVMMDLMGDDELPESMKGYAPVFVREDGSTVWVRMSSLSPFASVGVSRVGDFPIPSALNLAQVNPWISTIFRLEGGKTEFEVGMIPYGGGQETWVQTGTGDAWRYLGDGRIRKIIPQAPLISTLAHAFPTTRILEEAFIPYQMETGSWLFDPEPIRNPDGSIKYPRDYWRVMSALLLPTRTGKREEFIRKEKLEIRKYLRSLKTQYRRADPEERKYILGIFRDYAHYGLRVAGR